MNAPKMRELAPPWRPWRPWGPWVAGVVGAGCGAALQALQLREREREALRAAMAVGLWGVPSLGA